MGSMKVHQFARGLCWDQHEPSLTLGCKRLRPLAPKLPTDTTTTTTTPFDLKSFIRPDSGPRKLVIPSDDTNKKDNPPSPQQPQVEINNTHPGGTRWNPTQEQIGILEMLYRGGMRTPNAEQIEQITAQLGKYGKIEGKNVFYWFQNHKARERQKQKRNSLALAHTHTHTHTHTPRTPTATHHHATITIPTDFETQEEDDSPYKKRCRTWAFECFQERRSMSSSSLCREQEQHPTLELFPLHPEGR